MSSPVPSTREKILRAARQLIEARAGKSVRMSDIAKAAGVSRQALYLHFATRAELFVATARHLDEVLDMDARLVPSRGARTGRERIAAYIAAWAQYMPEIRAMATALLAIEDSDPEAAAAWRDRMAALRHGCHAAISDLARDGDLAEGWTVETATDLFWVMLSFRSWDTLTAGCGWTTAEYTSRITRQALASFAR